MDWRRRSQFGEDRILPTVRSVEETQDRIFQYRGMKRRKAGHRKSGGNRSVAVAISESDDIVDEPEWLDVWFRDIDWGVARVT